jgi:diguanylate cyclase (GGDEF)-like protein
MPNTEPAPLPGRSGAALEPYAQLVRALLPRASMLSVFDARGELYWSTEMAITAEMTGRIAAALRSEAHASLEPGQQCSVNGDPVYLFWLRRDDAAAGEVPFATVAVSFKPGNEQEPRPFSRVQALVRPAIECLRRELIARDEIRTLHSSLLEHDNDLALLLSVSGGDPRAEGADDLRSVLASATEHVNVGLAVLIVPEKGLVLIQASAHAPLDRGLLAKVHRHLLSVTQLRKDAVIINEISIGAVPGAEPKYRILACSVARADGRHMGVLALFRAASQPEFTPHQARLMQLLARRVAAVVAVNYDALTGLLTRSAFEQRARAVFEESGGKRNPWSALYIDMDRMHVINDNYGMHTGDRVIAQTGELIRARLPPGAFAARISGDRFAIFLPAALADAGKFAESLRAGAEQLGPVFGDGKMQISVSIGVADVDPHRKEFAHAFATAETACKAANDRGRNRVELFQEADESIVQRFTDINLIADVRDAIAENRLQLYAQLIVPLGAHSGPLHFEILLRMLNKDGETVGPDRFMSAALRYQLMPTIDRWVIAQSVAMLKPYAAQLANCPAVFTLNFSGQSLQQDAEFTDHVISVIKGSGLNPAMFCFELTESAAIGNLGRAELLMRGLRKLGCNIALDDFGTGLSSLAYLRSLPIGMVKIDGSFVRDVLRDPRADSMVHAIAQLARSMGLVTVAEYVETEEIRTRVTALGVDYGQGFAIAQPTPLCEVLAELPLYLAAAPRHRVGAAAASDGDDFSDFRLADAAVR